MKSLLPLLLLSFGAAAQVPMMNFAMSSDNATVCNTTNLEKPNTDPNDSNYGVTEFRVMFHAIGCAGENAHQTEVCNAQVVQAGQCVSYHYRFGLSRRNAQICVPQGHGGATDDWNCGTGDYSGHFNFPINNDQSADVNHLHYERHEGVRRHYYALTGVVAVHKH